MGMILTPIILFPAMFLKRVKLRDAFLGGSCFGSSLGGVVHWWYPMGPPSPGQDKAGKGL
jgi:hypothetical protein